MAALPYDIYFPTTTDEHKDADGRLHITRRRVQDNAGCDTHMLYDILGASAQTLSIPRTRGCAYPAASLVWLPGGGLGTVSVGTREHVRMEDWLRRSSNGSRLFVGSDGHTYAWTYHERDDSWVCQNDSGHVVASATDDPFRTLTLDQHRPHLGIEILASFLIVSRITKS